MRRVPRIAILYPGVGAADDYAALEERLGNSVRLPVTITPGGDVEHTVARLREVGDARVLLESARDARADPQGPPDSLVWACTSGSFVFGWRGAREQAGRLEQDLGIPVSSTSLAFVAAVQALGCRAVSVAASYPDELAQHFRGFLREVGIEVVHFGAADIATAGEVGRLTREGILDLVRPAALVPSDAVLVPDTAMHSLAHVEALEAALGTTVLMANQVSVWEGLRIAGIEPRLPGLGRLFRSGAPGADVDSREI